jgi:hypothetical protein
MQCPKCGSGVPDGSKQCHICFAPLDQAAAPSGPIGLQTPPPRPQQADDDLLEPGIPGLRPPPAEEGPPPNYLAPGVQPQGATGGGGGQVRVSLTGEVIEAPSSSAPHPMGPTAYPPPGAGPRPGAPMPPPGPPSSRGSYTMPARREYAPAKKGSGGVVAVILVILLLAGGGGFGYWYWQKQRAPIVAADKLMKALQGKDWKTVYQMVEFPPEQKAMITEQVFEMGMGLVGNLITFKEYKIGSATITGDTAKVSVTATVELSSSLGSRGGTKTSTEDLPLKLVNGEWKLDASAAGYRGGGIPGFGGTGGSGRMKF